MPSFFVKGPLPGMNELIAARAQFGKRTGGKCWNAYSALKNQWEQVIRAAANKAEIPMFSGPVEITFVWLEKDKRRDLDNIRTGAKLILDALVECAILPDDSQRYVTKLTDCVKVDKQTPGVWVEIREVNP